jgi:predicted dinucleotide-binding enzyme
MKIGVLGTGMVGDSIASKLVSLDHDVMMGSRSAQSEAVQNWVKKTGAKAKAGTFAETASFGEMLFNCTKGMVSLDALRLAGANNMRGKVLVDVANPLDFSKGMPPSLSVCNTDSLGEQIQREFPDVKVVKTLNTVNCNVMVNPALVRGKHSVFLSGNDAGAKATVRQVLTEWFGWQDVIDLGDITTARGTEQLLPVWVRIYGAIGTPNFNFAIIRA